MSEFIRMLARELQQAGVQIGSKAVGTPTFGPPYSGTGLFSNCGFEDAVLTAFVGEGHSIIDDIPWMGTEYVTKEWEVITNVVEGGEAEPTSDCAECPTASLRSCWLNTCFGRYCRSTEEFSFERFFERNPGAQTRRLFGGITGLPTNLAWGNGQPLDALSILTVAAGYSLRAQLVGQAWTGNPGLTAPPGYEEMAGLQLLVNTGLVDAFNGQACGALDSDVKPYNDCIGDTGAPDITRFFAYLRRQKRWRISAAQLDPNLLRTAIYMREEMWEEIAENWPALEYARMGANTGNENAMLNRVQEIKNRQALPIDGEWVPVVFDSGIPGAYNGTGTTFTADIYYLALSYANEPMLYGEYLDFRVGLNAMNASALFSGFAQSRNFKVVDNGRFLIVPHDVGGTCIDARVVVRPRILVRAPWLQGRITNVCVRLLQPFPGPDYPGFVPGGHASVTARTLHGPCD